MKVQTRNYQKAIKSHNWSSDSINDRQKESQQEIGDFQKSLNLNKSIKIDDILKCKNLFCEVL